MRQLASRNRELLPGGIALAGFLVFVLPVAHPAAAAMLLAIAAVIPLLVRHRVWRTLSPSTSAVLAACLCAVLVVLATTGGTGLWVALYVVYGLLVYVVVTNLARSAARRTTAVLAMCAVGLLELSIGWGRWVAGGDPNAPMIGSVGHWNQFAMFLLVPGMIAGFLFVRGVDGRSRAALCAATFVGSGAGIWLSTSRTCLGLFVLGWLASVGMVWHSTNRGMALLRWCAVPIGVVAAVLLLANPLFFHGRSYGAPITAHGGARGTSTLSQNGGLRLTYLHATWQIFRHHPLVGSGFGVYPRAAAAYLPSDLPWIFGSYNAWLDGLAAGGLVYGLPLMAAGLAAAGAVVRAARRAWRARRRPESALVWGVVAAAVASFGHLLVDADTYFPQVVAVIGAIVGLAHAAAREGRSTPVIPEQVSRDDADRRHRSRPETVATASA